MEKDLVMELEEWSNG